MRGGGYEACSRAAGSGGGGGGGGGAGGGEGGGFDVEARTVSDEMPQKRILVEHSARLTTL